MNSMVTTKPFKDIGNTAVECLSKSKPNLDPGSKTARVTEKNAHQVLFMPAPSPLAALLDFPITAPQAL
jgi:hypothetical protein